MGAVLTAGGPRLPPPGLLTLTDNPPPSCRRVWQEMSLLSGSDVSWGLVALICKLWDIGPLELEGPKALALEGSVDGRCLQCVHPQI